MLKNVEINMRMYKCKTCFPLDLGVLQDEKEENNMIRRIVEHTSHLDIKQVKDLETGSIYKVSWNNSVMLLEIKGDKVVLHYKYNNKNKKAVISFDSSVVGYGTRTWFNCPICRERFARVYIVDGVFGCRLCHNLTYITSRKSGNELRYLNHQVRQVQLKLGGEDAHITDRYISKPKNMHWRTYERLQKQLMQLQDKREAEWNRKTQIILDRYG